jgi:RNA polymerase sigma-70 factor (ECF subfamily)
MSQAGRQVADEVVSDTFLVAWRRFDDLPDPVLPWLFGVARNVLREQARASRNRQSLADELQSWTTAEEGLTADPADVVAERLAVLTALAGLHDDDRELLTLVAWHGLSPAQAAAVIGCSTATYSVRLHRARKRLERALKDIPDPRRLARNNALSPYAL